jgi:hypothetical protein
LATGVGLADAALYAKEDDYSTAGLVAAFSLLPGIGAIAKKIPGVKELGKKGMKNLAAKIKSGSKGGKVELNAAEKSVVASLKDPATQQAIKPLLAKEVKKNATKVVSNPSIINKIGSTGVVIMKELAKIGTTAAVGSKIGSEYAESGSGGPLAMLKNKYGDVSKEQWVNIKKEFGSDSSKGDNILLAKAIKSGWLPGKDIPEEFQTKTYKDENEELSDSEYSELLEKLKNL